MMKFKLGLVIGAGAGYLVGSGKGQGAGELDEALVGERRHRAFHDLDWVDA